MARAFYLSCSLEISLIAHDFPLDEVLELVWRRNIMLVRLDLLVSLHNAEVHASQIDLPRVLLLSVSDKREVSGKELGSLLDVVLRTGFVVQKAEFESGVSLLGLLVGVLLIAQVKDLH